MFRQLEGARDGTVEILLDGIEVKIPAGIPLAAALLLANPRPYRLTAIGSVARAPYCMMGSCFDCLVEIDGRRNRRACQVEVEAGMQVRRQLATDVDQRRED